MKTRKDHSDAGSVSVSWRGISRVVSLSYRVILSESAIVLSVRQGISLGWSDDLDVHRSMASLAPRSTHSSGRKLIELLQMLVAARLVENIPAFMHDSKMLVKVNVFVA